MQGPGRVIESGCEVGEGGEKGRRMFEIFPRPTRGSRWEIFIDSYPPAEAYMAPGQYDFSARLLAPLAARSRAVYLRARIHARECADGRRHTCLVSTLFVRLEATGGRLQSRASFVK